MTSKAIRRVRDRLNDPLRQRGVVDIDGKPMRVLGRTEVDACHPIGLTAVEANVYPAGFEAE